MRTRRRRRRSRRGVRGWSRQPFAVGAFAIALALILGLGGGLAIGRFWNGETPRLAGPVAPAAVPVVPSEKPFQSPPAAETTRSLPPTPPAMSEPPRRPTRDVPAWERFAALPPAIEGRAMIAIVIDDLGLDRPRTRRAIALPAPLTLAFLPYARGLPELASMARGGGHEILVHLPMEPDSGEVDPGPGALLTDLGRDETLRRLRWALDQVPFHVGVNNHMGSRFTRDGAMMGLVLGELKVRGLLFLDSRTTAHSRGEEIARRNDVPVASRHVFLDDEDSRSAIAAQLKETETQARRRGYAVAIGHPRDVTLELLTAWLPRLQERGFVLVPVTTIIRHNGGAY